MKSEQLSRRAFIGSVGVASVVASAGILAGCSNASSPTAATGSMEGYDWEDSVDIIVIGSGSGLMSAMKIAEAGKSVMVLEKRVQFGGETSISGGVIYAGGNTIGQQAFDVIDERTGAVDTIEATYDDWVAHAVDDYNPELVRKIIEMGPTLIEWFINQGVEFSEVYQSGTDPIRRGHQSSSFSGGAYTGPLVTECENLGVKMHNNSLVTDIIADNELNISGVQVLDSQGKYHYYECRAIVLAAGGTEDNKAMCMQYNPEALKWATFGSGTNMGESFYLSSKFNVAQMGTRSWLDPVTPVGSLLANLGSTSVIDPGIARYNLVMRGYQRAFIYVNLEGKRFTDETKGYPNYVGVDMAAQNGGYCYSIMDSSIWTLDDGLYLEFFLTAGVPLEELIEKGEVIKADSLAELAQGMGYSPAIVEQAVSDWNTLVSQGGEVDSFGRPGDTFRKIEEAPFYSWKTVPASCVPFAGAQISLSIDEGCRALNWNQQVIPGLFVCGVGTSNAPATGHGYPGSGACLSAGFAMGIISAESAVEYINSLS